MKLSSKVFVLPVIAIIFFLSMPAVYAARKQVATKVGIFDMQRIIKESKAGQKAKATLEKELNERRKKLAAEEQQLQAHMKEVSEGKNLDYADRRKKERELARELKELKRLRADLEDEIRNIDQELTIELLKDVVAIIKTIGEKDGYSIIMQKSATMVYIDDAIDITSEIVRGYDKQYKR